MRVRAFLDANVLYRSITRSVLVTFGELDAFQPLWSDQVNDEWMRNLQNNRPDLDPRRIARTRALMDQYVDEARVTGFEPLIDTLILPDPKDRHVLAAAVSCKADYLVTFNLKDFSPSSVRELHTAVVGPSIFLKELWSLDPSAVEHRLRGQAEAIGVSTELLLDRLAKSVPGFVKVVRQS